MTGGQADRRSRPAIELGIVDRRIDGDLRERRDRLGARARGIAARARGASRDLPVPPSRPADFEEFLRATPGMRSARLPAPPRIVEALASAAMLPCR